MHTGFRSPVVVIKSTPFNTSRINSLAGTPVNVLMEQSGSGLPKASVIDVSQILTVDKSFLTQSASRLCRDVVERIDSGYSCE